MAIPSTLVALLAGALLTAPAIADAPRPDAPRATPPQTPATPAVGAPEFPRDWFWGNDQQRRAHDALVGKKPPALEASRWFGDAQSLASLRGKVVVVDFWATWCGPCMRALPMHKELVAEFADEGFAFIGIHDSRRGVDRIEAVMKEHAITYPIAVDDAGKSVRAWGVAFWPTYAVIDREGHVRAVGLQPQHVPTVVRKLVAEPLPEDLRPAPPAAAGAPRHVRDHATSTAVADGVVVAMASPLPMEWTERPADTRAELDRIVGRPAPALPTGAWLNSAPRTLESLRGSVILLDFWATWCGPCIKAIPDLNAIQQRYADRGLVVIGVCHPRGAERMAEVVDRHRIRYPVVSDPELATIRAYRVDTYPDYYLIDRAGRLRGVDLRFEHLDSAIRMLLAE